MSTYHCILLLRSTQKSKEDIGKQLRYVIVPIVVQETSTERDRSCRKQLTAILRFLINHVRCSHKILFCSHKFYCDKNENQTSVCGLPVVSRSKFIAWPESANSCSASRTAVFRRPSSQPGSFCGCSQQHLS